MLDRLAAEEHRTAAVVAAVGRGLKAGHWIGRQWQRWGRIASGPIRARKASPAEIGAMGIGVKVTGDGRNRSNR